MNLIAHSAFVGTGRSARLLLTLSILARQSGAVFAAPPSGNYSTTFATNENPISESGAWSNIDGTRSSIETSRGRAFGTQAGGAYDDSVAWLNGAGPPDMQLTATVFHGSLSGIKALELRLRGAQTASPTIGYELN